MSRLVEIGTLIARAKSRADKEVGDHNSPTDWRTHVSEVWGTRVFSTVAELGLRYFETSTDLTSDGSAYVTEPANLLSHIRLDYIDTAGRHWPLIQLDEFEESALAGQPSGGRAYFFAAVDNQIFLYPTPASGQTYRLLYIPQAPDVSTYDDDNCVDCVTVDGEAAVIWGAAGYGKSKGDQDLSRFEIKADQHQARLLDWALKRFRMQPQRPRMSIGEVDLATFDPADYRWSRT